MRFWNISHCAEHINYLLEKDESALTNHEERGDKFNWVIMDAFRKNFDYNAFSDDLCKNANDKHEGTEWEFALVHGLSELFPNGLVERTGGRLEKKHGTDILIRIPKIIAEGSYGIAIQVKDYQGKISDDVIEQLSRCDVYFSNKEAHLDEKITIIDKYILTTSATESENEKFLEKCTERNIHVIFASDLREILVKISKKIIGKKLIENIE